MTGEVRRHNNHSCPNCGHHIDASTSLGSRPTPADGDVTMCWYCGEIGRFVVTAFGVSIRKLTDRERPEIEADPEVARFRETRIRVLRDQG